MPTIKLLDCTLRDGGYQNDWRFGAEEIRKIIELLTQSGVNIVECGFLSNKNPYQPERSVFNTVSQVNEILSKYGAGDTKYVCMANYGEYDIDSLPKVSTEEKGLSGIRIAFHKKDCAAALHDCKLAKEKGYEVYVQAMSTQSYSDSEFLDLLGRANKLSPHSFYIVDSFGNLKPRDLLRFLYLADENLSPTISIGFHGHNNLQYAYSNAVSVLETKLNHNLIFDVSVFGMGRGAGNLNLELFAEHLNQNCGTSFDLVPVLKIVDEIINQFYKEKPWGYSLPNYLSAKYSIHPNYVTYLSDIEKLSYEGMNQIISSIDDIDKKLNFDKAYIEQLYISYLSDVRGASNYLSSLVSLIRGRTVLMICPGKSAMDESDKIIAFHKNSVDIVSISVNFDYPFIEDNYIFVSNIRRYKQLCDINRSRVIALSNMPYDADSISVDYKSCLVDAEDVRDNAGLMLVKLLVDSGAKNIVIAGMDGYSHNAEENYFNTELRLFTGNDYVDRMNKGINSVLSMFAKESKIEFLTTQSKIRY